MMTKNFVSRFFNWLRNHIAVLLQRGGVQMNGGGNERLFGIYRGTVTSNIDPELSLRLQVIVPEVLGGQPLTFAEACIPAVDSPIKLPAVGAGVWIMFEAGDPSRPVWMGSR